MGLIIKLEIRVDIVATASLSVNIKAIIRLIDIASFASTLLKAAINLRDFA